MAKNLSWLLLVALGVNGLLLLCFCLGIIKAPHSKVLARSTPAPTPIHFLEPIGEAVASDNDANSKH